MVTKNMNKGNNKITELRTILIAEILLKIAFNKINQIKSIYPKNMSTNVCSTISFPFNFIACISPLKSTGPIFSKFRYDFARASNCRTVKLDHLRLRVERTLYCNLQSRARNHVVWRYIEVITVIIKI
jgi:hypothetical protein